MASEDQTKKLRQLFDLIDTDHNGVISLREWYAFLKRVKEDVDLDDAIDSMEEIDDNEDRTIDFDEYLQAVSKDVSPEALEEYIEKHTSIAKTL